jgi:ubiquinone/menaquinone biosynthesis C-methylase UbiE
MKKSDVRARKITKGFTYPLPDSSSETERLIQQSAFINPFTRALFMEAGIAPSMSVLDVGSGAGDVALLAADLVGSEGRVVGVDRNGAGLGVARARAKAAGFSHVTFREGNLTDIGLDEKFDAVVGRLVLMYQPDPAATLRRLASHLKSGGIVAFGEYNITPDAMRAPADMPLTGKLFGWIDGAFRYAGAETRMADRLFRTYRDAGLANPKLNLMSYIGGGQEWDGYAYAAATVRSLMPLILKAGLASADEIGIDTLEERLRTEAVAANGVIRLPELINAWALVP